MMVMIMSENSVFKLQQKARANCLTVISTFTFVDLEAYLIEKKALWEEWSNGIEENYVQAEQSDSPIQLRKYAAQLEIIRYIGGMC